jgi:deoxyribonuclease V
MRIHPLHSWNLTPSQAVALQRDLAGRVRTDVAIKRCELVAGADVSYNRYSTTLHAGIVVLRTSDWTVVEQQGVRGEATFPYVPGLLSFREVPVLLQAFALVQAEPDLIFLDGQGRAHPRRLGIACHVGLWLDRPCLGCAKSRLTGRFGELNRETGSTTPLVDKSEVVGQVVRTKTGVNPVFVSPGHKIDLDSAVSWVLAAAQGYRIPEPTRQADQYVNALRRAHGDLETRHEPEM